MATQRLPAEQRRRQLLAAATRVFARRGFHGATTKAIAREAGVAEALIYRYFPSKDALFATAVERTAGRLVEGLERILDHHGDDPASALSAALAFFRDKLERNPELSRMIFLVSAELDDPELRRIYLPHQERALDALVRTIRRWQERGLVQDTLPARAAAWLIMGTFQVVALMKHTGRLEELDVGPTVQLVRAFLPPTSAGQGPGATEPAA